MFTKPFEERPRSSDKNLFPFSDPSRLPPSGSNNKSSSGRNAANNSHNVLNSRNSNHGGRDSARGQQPRPLMGSHHNHHHGGGHSHHRGGPSGRSSRAGGNKHHQYDHHNGPEDPYTFQLPYLDPSQHRGQPVPHGHGHQHEEPTFITPIMGGVSYFYDSQGELGLANNGHDAALAVAAAPKGKEKDEMLQQYLKSQM